MRNYLFFHLFVFLTNSAACELFGTVAHVILQQMKNIDGYLPVESIFLLLLLFRNVKLPFYLKIKHS